MIKNPIIPYTMGSPDDQANKVREALNKKSIKPEDRVQVQLEDIGETLRLSNPNLKIGYGGWVICWKKWRLKPRGVE